jgi:hypothetical protein
VLFLPIKHNWVLSRTAQCVYLACAVFNLALLATLIGTHVALTASGTGMLNPPARSVVRFFMLPEIAGTALLWVAMWYFWFGFDGSHYFKRALFFVLLFFFAPFGTLLYYFFCYRSLVRQTAPADSERSDRKAAV